MTYVPSIKMQMLANLQDRIPTGGEFYDHIHGRVKILKDLCLVLDDLTNNPDPMKSRLAIDGEILRIKSCIRIALSDCESVLNDAMDAEKRRLDSIAVDAAGLIQDSYSQETRQVFRGMAEAEKHQFLANCITTGNGASMAAILEAPEHLTGMQSNQLAQYRDDFLAKTGPVGKQKMLAQTGETLAALHRSIFELTANATN